MCNIKPLTRDFTIIGLSAPGMCSIGFSRCYLRQTVVIRVAFVCILNKDVRRYGGWPTRRTLNNPIELSEGCKKRDATLFAILSY